MPNTHTLERLRYAVAGIRQLAVASAHSQLDMRAMKVQKTGPHAAKGPLERLDTLAVALAAPYLEALAEVEKDLLTPEHRQGL